MIAERFLAADGTVDADKAMAFIESTCDKAVAAILALTEVLDAAEALLDTRLAKGYTWRHGDVVDDIPSIAEQHGYEDEIRALREAVKKAKEAL